MYTKNGFYMPVHWKIINLVLVTLIVLSAVVVSFFDQNLLTFEGFTLSIWTLCFFILLYSFLNFAIDIWHMDNLPLYFSPWIFPVYKYNPKKNDVESHNGPALAFVAGFIILIFWAVICTVWVDPYYVGVCLGIVFELLLITGTVYIVSITPLKMQENHEQIDDLVIRMAWLDSKMGYINNRGAINRQTLLTYEKIMKRKEHLMNYIRMLENRNSLSLEEKVEGIELLGKDEIDISWISESKYDLSNLNSMHSCLFNLEKQISKIYLAEFELIV